MVLSVGSDQENRRACVAQKMDQVNSSEKEAPKHNQSDAKCSEPNEVDDEDSQASAAPDGRISCGEFVWVRIHA